MDMADIAKCVTGHGRDIDANRREISTHKAECEIRNAAQSKLNDDIEARMRVLESFRWKAVGAMLAVSGVASFAGGLIGNMMK